MLLETRIDENTIVLIDAEPSSGVEKSGSMDFRHPDDALPDMIALAGQIARSLSEVANDSSGPERLSVTFGVKVDGNAVVSLARVPEKGQFRVVAEWSRRS